VCYSVCTENCFIDLRFSWFPIVCPNECQKSLNKLGTLPSKFCLHNTCDLFIHPAPRISYSSNSAFLCFFCHSWNRLQLVLIPYAPLLCDEELQSTDHELIPARMRVLRQRTVPRTAVMFVTIQRENIRPSKIKMNKAVTMLKLPDVCSYAMNHYVSLSLTNMKSSVHLHALYSPRTVLRTFSPRRDQFVICGQ
jgi:hypothetical protein